MGHVVAEVEQRLELGRRQVRRNLGVGLEQAEEIALAAPLVLRACEALHYDCLVG